MTVAGSIGAQEAPKNRYEKLENRISPFISPFVHHTVSHLFLQTSSRRCSGTKIHLPPASPLSQVFRLCRRNLQTFRPIPASRALLFLVLQFSIAPALDFRRVTNRHRATILESPHPPRISSRQQRTLPKLCRLPSMMFRPLPHLFPPVLVTTSTGRAGPRISPRLFLYAICKLITDLLQCVHPS